MVILVCGLKSVTASEVVVISNSKTSSKVSDQSSSHYLCGLKSVTEVLHC
jgi:hypothetical protein